MITICFVYFKSLTLRHLAASLYSVRQQYMSFVKEIIIVENDTTDPREEIQAVIDALDFRVPVRLVSVKHGIPLWTHSWSTNLAVSLATTNWIFFCRADYLLAFDIIEKFGLMIDADELDIFVTSNGSHLSVDIDACESTSWRQEGPKVLKGAGTVYDYTCIDAGVWLSRRDTFVRVGGLDKSLTAWGHSQTHFQWKLYQSGTKCKRVDEVLFYHPQHGGAKDLDLANQQVAALGVSLQEMWARYQGARIY